MKIKDFVMPLPGVIVITVHEPLDQEMGSLLERHTCCLYARIRPLSVVTRTDFWVLLLTRLFSYQD
ncbi:MAG: hypothetical protein UU77_C0029G0010 [candidate division WWE3 bacterium GW2011_GWC1_41_7]|uniref:Uncharacterized protein n=3 Tax=Katanobacteria TaxID=422282 RepID=A0A0G0X5J1_UNCKA|nr:MAG: hypothetical protein UU72_C0008G0038 [candidate division WWE3 bacterium GW2011_GWB1_41_6]KKS20329.1 MAG: hypothetical protein UU77_C0029G0010 [candidate division WWE3 bacterium GW2011_GWC1_41_7]KKS21978.1 MAG: hypothetical protein UU80_C0016G0010 [candidate division WWE3 bacterium GW2011_GWA1_41_8]